MLNLKLDNAHVTGIEKLRLNTLNFGFDSVKILREQSSQYTSISRFKCILETPQLVDNPINVLKQHTDSVGDTFTYYFGGVQKVLVSSNKEIIRHVLKTNHSNYHKSPIQTKHMVRYLGLGLLSDNWENWRPKRRIFQRSFNVSDLDDQSLTMHASLDEYIPTFDALIDKGPLNFSESLCEFIFTMTARTLFGISMPAEEINQISLAVSKIQNFMVHQVFQPYRNPWFKLSGQVASHQKIRREGDQLLLNRIKTYLSSENTDQSNLLDTLLSMLDEQSEPSLTLEQVLAETMQFIVAGHETSSNALTWIFTLLGQYPRYYKVILDEFKEVAGDRKVVYSDMNSLEKTSAIIDESLRLYPPFWMLDRIALGDDRVGDISIKKGESIMCFIYGLHHNSELWHKPNNFSPERFYGNNQPQKKLYNIPFGAGPRQCIAGQFAKIQMIILLQTLLSRYRFSDCSKQKILMEPRFTLGKKGGLMVNIEKR